jgi:hypothetical protein
LQQEQQEQQGQQGQQEQKEQQELQHCLLATTSAMSVAMLTGHGNELRPPCTVLIVCRYKQFAIAKKSNSLHHSNPPSSPVLSSWVPAIQWGLLCSYSFSTQLVPVAPSPYSQSSAVLRFSIVA